MVTARFFNIDWNVNQNEVKFLTGLETEYKIKTDTDGNSGKQKAGGIELRPLNFSYTLNTFAGADIPKEIKKLRAIRGVVAPFYLNGKRLFAPAFMFVKFSIGNVQLTNDGQWVSCDVNLNFTEANFSLGTSSLRVIYNEVEITKKIEVFHDAYYDFHEYTIRNGCDANVCEKTKVESLGSVMDFISSNKPYFLAVKKLKRSILLKMGLV